MMKKTLVAMLGLVAGASANVANNRRDGTERGVDCGADAGFATNGDCTCLTDLARTWQPPTLINVNSNRDASDTRETGIVNAPDGSSALLEVAVSLDAGVWGSTDATDPDHLVGGAGGQPALTAFVDGQGYVKPSFWFVNHNAGTDAAIAACTFTSADPAAPTTTAGSRGFGLTGTAANRVYGVDGASCGTSTMWGRIDFRFALKNCGFKKTASDSAPATDFSNAPGSPSAGTGVVGTAYTEFLGKFKVQQTRQNGVLRAEEVALREDYPFVITVLYPENIEVTAQTISVVGQAEHGSTITHQIFNPDTTAVDINALFGTTYPYAISTATLTRTSDSATYDARLYLNATNTPACAGTLILQSNINWATLCPGGYTTAQWESNVVCDYDGDGLCSLHDLFTVADPALTTPYDHTAVTSFNTATPGGTPLPVTRCFGENIPASGATNINYKACFQNLHTRLIPRAGRCDVDADFNLVVNAVCRDDADGGNVYGPGAQTTSDSLITSVNGGAGVGTTDCDVRDTADDGAAPNCVGAGSTPDLIRHLSATGSTRLYQPNGDLLTCDTKQYIETINPQTTLYFKIRSDNFCARVIATGQVYPALNVYESEYGAATWGANCNVGNAVDTNTCITTSSGDDSCVVNAAPGAYNSLNRLCKQVPLHTSDRDTQNTFVFGTTTYLETTVYADAGVNIDTTTISRLVVAAGTNANSHPTGATDDDQDTNWQKVLIDGGVVVGGISNKAGTTTLTNTEVATRVKFSNNIITDSMILQSTEAAGTTGRNFFSLGNNPCAKSGSTNTNCARLGTSYEGVSRASVLLDEFTIRISDPALEAPETVKFFADIAITYKAANVQGSLPSTASASTKLSPEAAMRARILAGAAVTGGQASASATVRPSATSGTAGSSSTIAGFSSTTVLAAAAVLGAVVVAAGASFFVARKRSAAAARSAKRSSSSTELNDTLAVQA